MTRSDDADEPRSIPVEEYPDPVLEYDLSQDGPVVRAVNDAFRSTFGRGRTGTPVDDALEAVGLRRRDEGDGIEDELRAERSFTAPASVSADDRRGSTRYHVTGVPNDDEDGGHVVFAAVRDAESTEHELGLDRVASVVSHDLRNPLEVARTRLRVGRETGDDEHFEHVERAHDRMERIVEDVLTLARGEDAIDPSETVDLGEVAETAWDSVDTDGASLVVDDPLPSAVADPDRTGRLFENLFRNAVEHGGAAPTVRIGTIERDGTTGLYVADDGPGIPADERDAVLDPGYSTHDHGTGLGLAIVDRIADAHGWTVHVTASEQGGARIEMRDLAE